MYPYPVFCAHESRRILSKYVCATVGHKAVSDYGERIIVLVRAQTSGYVDARNLSFEPVCLARGVSLYPTRPPAEVFLTLPAGYAQPASRPYVMAAA